jgi:hypothetical protein
MDLVFRLVLATLVLGSVACTESSSDTIGVQNTAIESPFEKWLVNVATATSLDAEGGCHLDDLGGQLFLLTADATQFSNGYSEERFCSLRVGMSEAEVLKILGQPLSESWEFSSSPRDPNYEMVFFESKNVESVWRDSTVSVGMTAAEVLGIKGSPRQVTLNYSSRNEDTHYRQRSVYLIDGRVTKIRAGVYVD